MIDILIENMEIKFVAMLAGITSLSVIFVTVGIVHVLLEDMGQIYEGVLEDLEEIQVQFICKEIHFLKKSIK